MNNLKFWKYEHLASLTITCTVDARCTVAYSLLHSIFPLCWLISPLHEFGVQWPLLLHELEAASWISLVHEFATALLNIVYVRLPRDVPCLPFAAICLQFSPVFANDKEYTCVCDCALVCLLFYWCLWNPLFEAVIQRLWYPDVRAPHRVISIVGVMFDSGWICTRDWGFITVHWSINYLCQYQMAILLTWTWKDKYGFGK